MQFFKAQDQAKKLTFWLLALFFLNVFLISGLNAALIYFLLPAAGAKAAQWAFFISILVFVSTTLYFLKRAQNGTAIAELMGGRLLTFPLQDENEKKLFNVVEEMAIASGTPIPFIYVLDGHDTINAFAAGTDAKGMVIAVTRGALAELSRDELQAVIGHEFSHILNEDVELNVRIAGVVQGFQVFVKLGDILLRGRPRHSRTRRNKGVGGKAALLGLGLIAIGYLGFLMGRVIQSLISQQREYLADASSAQFTRNPMALAQALGKIDAYTNSYVSHSNAEYAHIFFAESMQNFFFQFLSTHPPVRSRIQRLVPDIKHDEFYRDLLMARQTQGHPSQTPFISSFPQTSLSVEEPKNLKTIYGAKKEIENLLASIGAPTAFHLLHSQQLLKNIYQIKDALHDPTTAKAALTLLIFYSQPCFDEAFSHIVHSSGLDPKLLANVRTLVSSDPEMRILLFQICLGTLRTLSVEDRQHLLTQMDKVFSSDSQWTAWEALLMYNAHKILLPAPLQGRRSTDEIKSAVQRIKSLLSQQGQVKDFQQISKDFDELNRVPLRMKERLTSQLYLINTGLKEQFEVFRLCCLAFGVPVPPSLKEKLKAQS